MLRKEGYFNINEAEKIYYQYWLPLKHPKAIVVLVHGLGSHSGWFSGVAQELVTQHYAVYALDLYGHGKSSGQRGHINSWAEYRETLDSFCSWIKSQHPEKPLFITGHSLGGLIVLEYILRLSPEIDGIVLMAPAFGKVGISPLKILIGKLLSSIYPRFSLDLGIDESTSSHYPSVISAYSNDPLRHTKATARFGQEYFQIIDWVENNYQSLSMPILVVQGDEDVVTLPEATREFFARLPDIDKEYKEYQGGYHDLHHDLCEQMVIQDIQDWLNKQSQACLQVK